MEFPQPASGVLQCLKSRDGRCLAVYRMDTGACEAVLYDLEDGELLGLQTLPDGQYEAALLPDGTVALLDEKRGQTFWYDGGLTQIQRQEEVGAASGSWRIPDTCGPWMRRAWCAGCTSVTASGRSISSPRGRSMPWWGSVRTGS